MNIQLLGPPAVHHGSVHGKVSGRQGALLAALALHAGRPVSTDRLVEVVWGHEPPGDAANALQQRVSRLRGVVDPRRHGDVLVQAGGGYMLSVADDQVDVRRFERLAAEGNRRLVAGDALAAEAALSQALELWRGPVLDGFADELWALGDCKRLEEVRLAVIEDRAQAMVGLGQHDRAVGDLAGPAAAEPLRERLCGLFMQALYGAGRQADALAVYEQTRRLLAEELGVDPGPQLQRTYHQLLTQDDDLDAGANPSRVPSDGNLPAPRGGIVGRENALAQVAQMLPHARLLTITGTGGAGKTTLAVEAARRHIAPVDGRWLVELAPVATGDAVVAAITDALGITGGGLGSTGVDAGALVRALAGKQALLVLDNCEHVLETINPFVEHLLNKAPGVQVLATSREPLGVAGEVVWSLPGLAVPDAQHATAGEIRDAPAVQLLVHRARAHTAEFQLTDDAVIEAATLVRRLDGIPLAIELAAARLRVLSLTEVTEGLHDRFRVLSGREGVSRHRTLRAALDWSWQLLDEPLRRAWAALAVPADRFDLTTASRLLADADVDVDALDAIADLTNRSLLDADTSTVPTSYRMLESLRDYGQQRLAELGLAEEVHAAHAKVVEAALVACHADSSAQRFDVDIEGLASWLDDARVALRWAHERGDRRRAQRLTGLLGWLWLLRGRSSEGLIWLDRGLPPPEEVDKTTDDPAALLWASALRAAGIRASEGLRWAEVAVRAAASPVDRVLAQVCAAGHYANAGRLDEAAAALGAGDVQAQQLGGWPLGFVRLIGGQLAWVSGDLDQARELTEEAVRLLSAAGAEWAHVHAQETLIDEASVRGDHRRARDLAREGVRLCRRQGYPELEAAMLTKLGRAAAELGGEEQAARLLDEAVSRAAAVGSSSALADAHIAAGAAARHRGELHTAHEHLRLALELLSGLQSVPETLQVHLELAFTAVHAGQADIATAHAGEALELAGQLGDPRVAGRCVEALAGALALTDDVCRAVTMLATAAAVRDAAPQATPTAEQRDLRHINDRVRARIDTATFDQTWAAAHERATADPGAAVARLAAALGGEPPQ